MNRKVCEPPTGQDKLYSVQLMRAAACLMVAFYHTSLIMAQPEYGSLKAFGWLTGKGWIGVNLFFVISGFVIVFAHSKDIGAPSRIGRYLWRRFSRVYPVYWICLVPFIGAALAGLGFVHFARDIPNLLTDFTLIQFVQAPSLPLKVAWTLCYEITFYAMFATLIVNRWAGLATMSTWFCVIIFNDVFRHNYEMGFASAWNLYFYFGIIVFFLFRKLNGLFAFPILFLGISGMALLGFNGLVFDRPDQAQYTGWNLPLMAPFIAMILLGVLMVERIHRFRAPAWAVLIGEASYSIYLVHSAIISLICGLNHKLTLGMLPPRMMFVLIASAAVAAGILTHIFVERALLRFTRSLESGPALRRLKFWRLAPDVGAGPHP